MPLAVVINGLVRGTIPARPIEPVNFSKVTIQDAFWKPRMDKVFSVLQVGSIILLELIIGENLVFQESSAH